MNSTNNKLNQFLASAIAENVDELGNFLQKLMVDSYLRGYNDAIDEHMPSDNVAYVLEYTCKVTGLCFMKGKDGKYHLQESGDLAGLDRHYLASKPEEYFISMVVDANKIVREVDKQCMVDGMKYTIHSFKEQPDGSIIVGIGPTAGEYMSPDNDKRFKVVKLDEIS
jgi:hypothetical protein